MYKHVHITYVIQYTAIYVKISETKNMQELTADIRILLLELPID